MTDRTAAKFKELLEARGTPWCAFDNSLRMLESNSAYRKGLGLNPDLESATDMTARFHPDDIDTFADNVKLVFDHSKTRCFPMRMLHFSGRVMTVEWALALGAEPGHLFGTWTDVTLQQRHILHLQQSQEVSGVGSWEIDLFSKELYWSDRTHAIHETDPHSYMPKLEDGISFYHPESIPLLSEAVGLLMSVGTPFDLVLKFITAKGRQRWVRSIARAVVVDGKVVRVYGTFEDITAEQEEKLAVARFKEIISTSQEGIWELDSGGGTVFANRQLAALLKVSPETMRLRNFFEFLQPDDVPRLQRFLFQSDESGGSFIEVALLNQDKNLVWIKLTCSRRRDKDGKVTSALAMLTDLTGLKDRELSLEKANERLEFILTGARLGAWDWWLADNSVYFDRRWCEMLGLDVSNVSQELSTWDERVHPDDKARVYEAIKAHVEGRTPYYENSHRMRHADGRWVWILDQGRICERDAIGKPVRFSGTHLDISSQKSIEDELIEKRSNEEKFFELSQEVMCVAGFDGYFKHVNPAFCRLMGLSEKEMLANPFLDLVHPDDRGVTAEEVTGLGQNKVTLHFENRYRTTQGDYRTISWSATPDVEKSLIYAAGRDVTLFRKAQNELHQTLNAVNKCLMVATTDRAGSILQVNEKFTEVTQYTTSELIGQNHRILRSGLHPPEFFQELYNVISSGKIWSGEFKNRRKNGEIYYVQTVIAPTRDQNNQVDRYMSFSVDLSDMRVAELKLIYASKMATLGEMAAGIAHEINNPLAIITGRAMLLGRRLKSPEMETEKIESDVETISITAERIAKVVRGLRFFTRNAENDPMRPMVFSKILDETLELCAEKLRLAQVTLRRNLKEDPEVHCRPEQISQVLLNLISNSVDAVCDLPEPWIEVEISCVDKEVVISVTDCGKGIPDETAAKIMQPFFTSKTSGKGTGLGLSISKGIIEAHSGKFFYDKNWPNTRFVIQIPKKKRMQEAA